MMQIMGGDIVLVAAHCYATLLLGYIERRKERNPLQKGLEEDIGTAVGMQSYITDKGTKGEFPGCVYEATRRHQLYVIMVLSGMRVVHVLCVCVDAPCCRAAGVGVGDATECARRRLTSPGSASTKANVRIRNEIINKRYPNNTY